MFFLAPISKSKPGLNNNWRQLPHTSHANQSEWYCKCLVDHDRNNTMIFVFTAVRRCRIYCSCRDMQLGALLFCENCKLMQDRVRKFMPMSSANQNPQTNWINQCEARKTKSERQKVCQETVRAFYVSAAAPRLHLTAWLCCVSTEGLAVKYLVSLKTRRLSQHLNESRPGAGAVMLLSFLCHTWSTFRALPLIWITNSL